MTGDLAVAVQGLLAGLDRAILAYFVAVNLWYLVLMVSAAATLRTELGASRHESSARALSSGLMPRITMLVPAYNEAATISMSLRALLTLAYPNLEVVVVDDGSTDETLALLVDSFDLVPVRIIHEDRLADVPVTACFRSRRFPHLVVASKPNSGKADTLNAALDLATGELVCAIDADTIVEPNGLLKLVQPFVHATDVVAAGGTIRVVNACGVRHGRVVTERAPGRPLAGFQAVEYLRAFLFGRLGWNRFGGNLVISGALGLFRRDSLVDADGYVATVGEDMELVVRLRRQGHEQRRPNRVEFVSEPVAWTEVPESMTTLGRQRDRWHRGLSDTLWRHRRVFGNPRYGSLGMVAFPTFVLVEWLGPVVEAVGLVALPLGLWLGAVDLPFALLYFAAAYGLGLVCSLVALVLEELAFRRYGSAPQRARLVLWAVLENIGYRQLTVFWRLRGIVGYLRGRTDWGAMRRTGFADPAEGPG